jgi:hypothetical protein
MNDRVVDKRGSTLTAAGGIDRKQGKTRSDDVPRGIVCMVIATILFAGASAASKWLVGVYPVGEVLCLAFVRLTHRRRGDDLAGQRAVGLRNTSATRPLGARPFASDLAALFAPRV